MEEQEPAAARKLKSLSYPHNPKSLVHIAAKAAFKQAMPEKVDENNLDGTLEHLNTLPSRIGQECAQMVQDRVLYEQPYPYFSETNNTYLMDACPILKRKVLYNPWGTTFCVTSPSDNNTEEAAFYSRAEGILIRDNFKFLRGKYLSYLEGTNLDSSTCVLNVFEDNNWKSTAEINPNDQIIDISLSPDRQLLALGLKNQKVAFWELNEDTQEWQKNEHEIDLSLFQDQLEASVYQPRSGRSYFKDPDKYYHSKKSDDT